MTEVQISTLKGGTIALSNDILTALQSELHGSLCLPDEAGYDEARTIWNAMIDRRPGAVVRCRGRKRRDACGAPCARQRPARGGARRWPQHRRQRGLRGRALDRPVADAVRPYRLEESAPRA